MKEWTGYVIQARSGDVTAFDSVVKEFQSMAVSYAYSILSDFQLAEDAAQEAFIEAFFCLKGLQEPVAFPAWFRKIVFKQCDRIIRVKKLQSVPYDTIEDMSAPGPTLLESAAQHQAMDVALAAINSLPNEERTATTLAYINGYSLTEIGDFLEVSVDTVKNRLRSARRKLRERMAGLVEDTIKHHAPGDNFTRRAAAVFENKEFRLV